MALDNSPDSDTNLQLALHNLRTLLLTFQQAFQFQIPSHASTPSLPNPLDLLSDASSLLKAQTTKLSLLFLNKPFSAKEVTYILNTLSKSILPALMSALELCPAEKYTRILHEHVKSLLGILWRELGRLLALVPEEQGKHERSRGSQEHEKDALACTGVLWEQCDALKRLGDKGLVGLVDEKVKAYGELLEDAIGELEEWDPDRDDSGEESDGDDEEEEQGRKAVVLTPTTSEDEKLDQGMQKLNLSTQNVLRARVLKYLRFIRLLYPAIRKRRVATFPNVTRRTVESDMPASERIENLGAIVAHVQRFSDDADELAGSLYSDDKDATERRLRAIVENARKFVQITKKGWNGQEDEYSAWIAKWTGRLEELEKG